MNQFISSITVSAGLVKTVTFSPIAPGDLPAGTGTVSTVSIVSANGVSGTVANATTTPALTIALGAITPTSVNASGTVQGSNLSGTNTGDQTITLTGAVTGSGTGSFATTIAAVPFGVVSGLTNANVAGDVSTSSSTMANVTGLSFAIGANQVWTVEFALYATGSLNGMTFQLTGPASPTNLLIFNQGDTTGVTLVSTDAQTAFGTPTQAYIAGVFSGLVVIRATIENGANAGTVQLQFASAVNTQTNIVKRGSYMSARRVS